MNNTLKQNLGLLAMSLIMFIVTLDTTITNIALPTITTFFKTNLDLSNWISNIYVLILSVLMIPASKIADQLGRKKLMLLGLSFFGVGSLFCGLSNQIWVLIGMRGIQGIGGAIVTPIMVPLCVSLFGRIKANQVVGEIGAIAALAAAVGPGAGGLIIHYWSWHLIFFINIPITIIVFGLIIFCFSESYDPTVSSKIDYEGILLLSVSLFLLTFVLLKGYDFGWRSPTIIFLIIGMVVTMIVFVITDIKKVEPLIAFDLFKDSTFLSSTIVYFTAGFTIVCSSVVFNFFLEDVLNFSTLHAGYIIMFSSVMVMIVMPLGNSLGQQFNFRWPILTGSLLMAVSLLLLTQISYQDSEFYMIFDMCVLGMGFGLASFSLVSAVQYIPEEKAGIASGMVNAARQFGTCLGIALLVGVLNMNIKGATSNIKREAQNIIRTSQLAPDVKKVANNTIQQRFDSSTAIDNKNIKNKELIGVTKKIVGVPKPAKSSDMYEVYRNNKKIISGAVELRKGAKGFYEQIKTGIDSNQLMTDAERIHQNSQKLILNQKKISIEIQLLAQKQVLTQAFSEIKKSKNKQLTRAFKKTFWLGTLLLFVASPIAYWTDKRQLTEKK